MPDEILPCPTEREIGGDPVERYGEHDPGVRLRLEDTGSIGYELYARRHGLGAPAEGEEHQQTARLTEAVPLAHHNLVVRGRVGLALGSAIRPLTERPEQAAELEGHRDFDVLVLEDDAQRAADPVAWSRSVPSPNEWGIDWWTQRHARASNGRQNLWYGVGLRRGIRIDPEMLREIGITLDPVRERIRVRERAPQAGAFLAAQRDGREIPAVGPGLYLPDHRLSTIMATHSAARALEALSHCNVLEIDCRRRVNDLSQLSFRLLREFQDEMMVAGLLLTAADDIERAFDRACALLEFQTRQQRVRGAIEDFARRRGLSRDIVVEAAENNFADRLDQLRRLRERWRTDFSYLSTQGLGTRYSLLPILPSELTDITLHRLPPQPTNGGETPTA